MKVPFFSKSKKAQSDVHLSSEPSGSSNVDSSGSLSFPGASGKKHRKSSSFSGPLDMLRKSSSFSMPSRQNSGKLFRLKSFRQRSGPLPKELKSVEVHSKELTETFKYFDKNGDGRISAIELGQVLRSVGIASTHEELDAMIREVDGDNDGFIDLAEFIQLNKVTQEQSMMSRKRWRPRSKFSISTRTASFRLRSCTEFCPTWEKFSRRRIV